MHDGQIVMAVKKGRLCKDVLPLLRHAGMAPRQMRDRRLLLPTETPSLGMLLLRGADVAAYVSHGIADLGVLGKDDILESDNSAFYEPLDLGVSCCTLVRAALGGGGIGRGSRGRVATKFVRSAGRHYIALGIQAEIIKLQGSVEIAPVLGLADEIVDLVDTGNTLRAHGLVALETVAESSARIIVNKAAMKRRRAEISDFLAKLRASVRAAGTIRSEPKPC